MEGIIFSGIQASGKSTFYIRNFFTTHVRISLDLLKTRARERKILSVCLATGMKIVIDNTNPSREDRRNYINSFRDHGYRMICYFFDTELRDALERNARREGKERIPDAGLYSAWKRLERPGYDEGFERIYIVTIGNGEFTVRESG